MYSLSNPSPRKSACVCCRQVGTVPYIPELPVHTEGIINYYQTLSHIRGLHTSPTGLKSTSLVLDIHEPCSAGPDKAVLGPKAAHDTGAPFPLVPFCILKIIRLILQLGR
ncbi:hypothetical protein DPMN_126833 [Dreissena polymorpha]|uniref:ER membrane protein complex subunit 1 C-terminal domain-containing protein n=1 Tax=Dreissena polymorpha TaxID=45954 RepID=A0A9D4H429_DREPO|nr:hypothetical protein DPMN_126833 [Dreissena polymorpha]